MFHVKYKLFCYIKYSSVPHSRGRPNCILSKFSPPIAFDNNNDTFHNVKIGRFPSLQPPTQLTVSKVFHFISKTLETSNISQENHSLKPCRKAEIDFVDIKCPAFNVVSKFVSECVKCCVTKLYWVLEGLYPPPVLQKRRNFYLKIHTNLRFDTCLKAPAHTLYNYFCLAWGFVLKIKLSQALIFKKSFWEESCHNI